MKKKKYSLVGVDGNAFSVMGYVCQAMKETGFTKEEQDAYTQDAMSDDYNHLLAVSVRMINKVNNK